MKGRLPVHETLAMNHLNYLAPYGRKKATDEDLLPRTFQTLLPKLTRGEVRAKDSVRLKSEVNNNAI